MGQNGTYYLSRVIKLDLLNQDSLQQAILSPVEFTAGKYTWTFTDLEDHRDVEGNPFIFGKMTRYLAVGSVLKVDPVSHTTEEIDESNLLTSVAPFVYLPNFSGISYLRVWNQIDEDTFRRRFERLISDFHDGFFHRCEIEPIADYRRFSNKICELETIIEMSAKIHPPNPLFGHLWEPLKNYLIKRRAAEIDVKEIKNDSTGINTEIKIHINNIINESSYTPSEPLDITDAALLMAADGYGKGRIVGHKNGSIVTVNTSDEHKSFQFEKSPDPFLLAQKALDMFEAISQERNMKH